MIVAAALVFNVLSAGDLIAITIALLANIVTVSVAVFIQRRETKRALDNETWRRTTEKRQRVHAHFASVLFGANMMRGMTGILQWKPDRFRSEGGLKVMTDRLEKVKNDLGEAAVNLTLEGLVEPVDSVYEMASKFFDFRERLQRLGERTEASDERQEMRKDVEAVAAITQALESTLPAILAAILPDRPEPRPPRWRLLWRRFLGELTGRTEPSRGAIDRAPEESPTAPG